MEIALICILLIYNIAISLIFANNIDKIQDKLDELLKDKEQT